MAQIKSEYIKFLKLHGAADIEHSSEDFLSHLKGTFNILVDWKLNEHVCLAGLFHSIYGTEVFKTSLIPESLKPEVVSLIGDKAERLAYLFGIMERTHFLDQLQSTNPIELMNRQNGKSKKISCGDFVDLCHIYVANRLEQHPRWPDEYRFCEFDYMKQMRTHLCTLAWTDLKKEYKLQ